MRNLLFVFIILFILPSNVFSQNNHSWCGTEISQDWMEAFYQRDKSHLFNKAGNYPEVVIPIIYHIVGDDNGAGYYELHDLFRSHCELQDLYNDADITFYIKEIDYINNTNYYDGNNTNQLFFQNDPNVCNVYIVSQMSGVCGYSYVPENWDGSGWSGPNRGGVMLAKNCMDPGNTTYRHEMGHYLNLPHTFYGWEGEASPNINNNAPNTINGNPVERANGTNCYSSGDGFCDTPPDYISDRWNCNFTRTFKDPQGNSFNVDEKNFMSYSNDGCSSYLKDEQLAEVNAAAAAHRPYLLNDPIPAFTTFTSMSGFAPSNGTANLNSNDDIIISWNKMPQAEYYQLQLTRFNFINPTVDIVVTDTFYVFTNPITNGDYEWHVRPISLTNACEDYTPIKTFSTSILRGTTTTDDNVCSSASEGSAEITMANPGTYSYYWSSDDPVVSNTLLGINSSVIDNLPVGTYHVIVVSASGDSLVSTCYVTAPNGLDVEINQVGSTLVATVTGGNPPYTTIWNTGANDLTLSGLESGTYNIIVVDQFGCQKTAVGDFNEAATSINGVNANLFGKLVLVPNPSATECLVFNSHLQYLVMLLFV